MSAIRRVLLTCKTLPVRGNFCGGIRTLSTKGPYEGNIITSEHSDVEIPNVTLQELVYSKIEKFYKYTAVECSETGRSYTFEQLRVKSRNLSKALRKKLGFGKGDTVAVLLPNVPEFGICILGMLEAGITITTLNPMYTAEEISRQLLDSSAKAIITLVDLYDTAKSASLLSKKNLPIVTVKTKEQDSLPRGAINFNELVDQKIDIPDIQPGSKDDIAFLPYSSGTTGLPKGVELSHYNIVANISQVAPPDIAPVLETTDSHQDVIPAVLPMFHIYGLVVTLVDPLIFGSKVIALSRFSPDLYLSVLKSNPVTIIYAAPPLVLYLAAHPDVKPEYLEHTRNVMSGAAPLGALDEERFTEKFGSKITIIQGYGLTETSPVLTMTTRVQRDKKQVPGSVGKLIPNTTAKVIAVDDPTGKPLGPNQSGELIVKGPQVMKQYHNKPEETKNAFLDGWFRTGDMLHYDEDGYMFVTDRLKELIKVKGFQVAPAELEEVIRDFPSVNDAAVIGIPHPIDGEVPRAFVVPKKDADLKTEELLEHVAKRVAKYKQLRGGIEIVDSIPKNAAGKILRRQLKLKYQETQ